MSLSLVALNVCGSEAGCQGAPLFLIELRHRENHKLTLFTSVSNSNSERAAIHRLSLPSLSKTAEFARLQALIGLHDLFK